MNPSKSHIFLSLALVLGMTTAVHADSLFTPPIVAQGGNYIECVAANVGNKTRDLTVEMYDSEGTIVGSQPFAIAPGQSRGFSLPGTAGGLRCGFIWKGHDDIRGVVRILQPGAGTVAAVPAE